jgi:hypothetical protein
MTTPLQAELLKAMTTPVHKAIADMAEAIRAHHKDVLAVLAYGSALRDSDPSDTLIDFYVLTQDLNGVSGNALSRALCRLVPPNVYYTEHNHHRAKYAVLPLELLAQKVSGETANPYFWARFAQPMRLVWVKDEIASKRLMQVMERAAQTAGANAKSLAPDSTTLTQWQALFKHTYATELRPEDSSRAKLIAETQREYFELVSRLAAPSSIASTSWTTRRWQGKLLSVLRLIKAAFTFKGGADYAAWKIKRHSGVDIEVKDWHRRHPLLASIVLLPKLLSKGALK